MKLGKRFDIDRYPYAVLFICIIDASVAREYHFHHLQTNRLFWFHAKSIIVTDDFREYRF